MTTSKTQCNQCGEYYSDIVGGLCQDCASIEFHKLQKDEFDKIDINKIKVVLCALWDNQPYPQAQEIVKKFKEEINRGN